MTITPRDADLWPDMPGLLDGERRIVNGVRLRVHRGNSVGPNAGERLITIIERLAHENVALRDTLEART